MNDMCATCHAKLVPLSTDFVSGDRFYDHFDLLTLEHPDFYPDGRDLGENYTFTSWSMSPCLKSGKLDCSQCHTGARPAEVTKASWSTSRACRAIRRSWKTPPPTATTRPAAPGDSCIACHMPMSQFAAMMRTDHSMRPPMPRRRSPSSRPTPATSATRTATRPGPTRSSANGIRATTRPSRSACAALLDAARKDQWQRLPEMLAEIENPKCDEVYRNSFVRLVRNCDDPRKWPMLIAALKDESPLVRASAASALEGYLTEESVPALLRAAADPLRLVRIRAAAALASLPPEQNRRRRCRGERCARDGRVPGGDGRAARRLGLLRQPGQLRDGPRRFRGLRGGLRNGAEARTPHGRRRWSARRWPTRT